jgi:tetratricopeptide (TPR) repeat protein
MPADPMAIASDYLGDLEYEQAIQQLRSWLKTHPEDLRALNCLGTALLYQEMFHRSLLESRVYGNGGEVFKASKVPLTQEFERQLLPILEKAQSLAETRAKIDPKDKESLYWAGVTHGTRATLDFVLRKEYVAALHESTEALDLHRRLLELDPQYVDAYLIVGMNNYVLGSLPWYIKVVAALTGRRGDREEGIRQVKRVTEEGTYARGDARLMLAVLYQREKMYRAALQLYETMAHDHPRNYRSAESSHWAVWVFTPPSGTHSLRVGRGLRALGTAGRGALPLLRSRCFGGRSPRHIPGRAEGRRAFAPPSPQGRSPELLHPSGGGSSGERGRQSGS